MCPCSLEQLNLAASSNAVTVLEINLIVYTLDRIMVVVVNISDMVAMLQSTLTVYSNCITWFSNVVRLPAWSTVYCILFVV